MKRADAPRHTRLAPLAASLFLALLAFSPVTLVAQGRSPKVVVNKETKISRLDREELARIYLGKKTLWENRSRIAPFMLDETRPSIEPFLETTLRKSLNQFQTYWKRLVFSGGGAPPRTFRTSAEVIEAVVRDPGGIGIVEADADDERVQVVDIAN